MNPEMTQYTSFLFLDSGLSTSLARFALPHQNRIPQVVVSGHHQVQELGPKVEHREVTTTLVRFAAPGLGPYSATKAAFECLLRSMSKELAGRGIRVNGVAPGPVDTDLFRSGKDEAAVQRSAAMSPFNRVGKPDEVAEVIAFLASPKSSWVAGQIVQPNGGLV